MENPLSGKVVIITGASSGIGAATARALARLGCKLTLAARSVDKLHALVEELAPAAMAVPTDMTLSADVKRMVSRTLEQYNRVDILFANAGIYSPGQFVEGDLDALTHLMDVNVNGVLRCVHTVLPHMIAQQSGDILITSSIAGEIDLRDEPIYSASKHAIQTIVHTLRRQVAAAGIRVGSIAPGKVANELWGYADAAEIDKQVMMHAALRSEDVAEAVIFMLSQPPHVTIRDVVMLPQNQDL
ncbi:MAG: SDR family oxidoreductase [Chitinophagaceae bacterium]|nr:SDR family oxidoreductase [Anaerolineae bacterium]